LLALLSFDSFAILNIAIARQANVKTMPKIFAGIESQLDTLEFHATATAISNINTIFWTSNFLVFIKHLSCSGHALILFLRLLQLRDDHAECCDCQRRAGNARENHRDSAISCQIGNGCANYASGREQFKNRAYYLHISFACRRYLLAFCKTHAFACGLHCFILLRSFTFWL
jgi:hypothetical protein